MSEVPCRCRPCAVDRALDESAPAGDSVGDRLGVLAAVAGRLVASLPDEARSTAILSVAPIVAQAAARIAAQAAAREAPERPAAGATLQ